MSAQLIAASQADWNKLSYDDLHQILWKITYTGKVQDTDWGNELDTAVKKQVKEWCKGCGVSYSKDLDGPAQIIAGRKEAIARAQSDQEDSEPDPEPVPETPKKTKADLVKQATELGLKGLSGKKKDEIQRAIDDHLANPNDDIQDLKARLAQAEAALAKSDSDPDEPESPEEPESPDEPEDDPIDLSPSEPSGFPFNLDTAELRQVLKDHGQTQLPKKRKDLDAIAFNLWGAADPRQDQEDPDDPDDPDDDEEEEEEYE